MNSKDYMSKFENSELKELILDYMNAFNNSDHAKAEELLQRIDQLRGLLDKAHGKDTK